MVQQPEQRELEIYGNLAAAALREHSEALVVMYHVAITLKRSPGDAGIDRQVLINELLRLQLFHSVPHIRGLLQRGHGVFWNLKAGRVWLRSIKNVANRLDAHRGSSYRQVVSTSRLRTPAQRRGALLGVALPDGAPICQRTVRQTTGVSERTQRRYRQAGHFEAVRQDADLTEASVGLRDDASRRFWARGNAQHGVYMRGGHVMKRIANKYLPAGKRLRRGRRSLEIFAAQPLNFVAEGIRTVPRVFFKSALHWTRYRQLKMGTAAAAIFEQPFNVAYFKGGGNGWIAIEC